MREHHKARYEAGYDAGYEVAGYDAGVRGAGAHSGGVLATAEEEIARLRARLQARESALRLLLDAAEDAVPMVSLIDDAACMRLLDTVRRINQPDLGTPVCSHCHRPLVVPQVLDHIERDTGWICMPCIDRASAHALASETRQDGDPPQTPRQTA